MSFPASLTTRVPAALERVLVTAWAGSLWIVGLMVAPMLFRELTDRRLAGDLAGHLFHQVSLVGLVCGVVLLAIAGWHKQLRHWSVRVVAAMLVITVVLEWWVFPQTRAIRQSVTGQMTPDHAEYSRFALLHGVSSLMYLANCLMALALVVIPRRD